MKTMQALRFKSYGPPSVLSIQDTAIPDLNAGEVLVAVHASGLNPSDVKNVAGVFKASLPRVPGRDYAGVVVSDGPDKGKEVWGSGPGFGVTRDGAHAQYVAVAADWLSEKPSNMSMQDAATFGVPYLAAWSSLVDAANVQAGETVLITGALGAVGRAGIQIAHWKKARVIGADISDGPSDADTFINSKNKDLPSEVKSLTDGQGVNVILDGVGGPLFEPALKSLALGGRHAVITSVGNRRVEFDLMDFYHNSSHLIGVDTMKLTGVDIARIMDEFRAGFEQGLLKPPAVKTWTFDNAVAAYTAVANGDASAKHVLLMR